MLHSITKTKHTLKGNNSRLEKAEQGELKDKSIRKKPNWVAKRQMNNFKKRENR